MCGLVGILSTVLFKDNLRERINNMKFVLRHRGPDGDGIFLDDHYGLGLGHQRLAIIDPEHGKQPMATHDGNCHIVFNGAIYNYLELRHELISRGHPIHSYSDTEVLLYAYKEWGQGCVDKLQGMFAFVIWDKEKKQLFCARDRIGIKPFYYFYDGTHLVFASEIKAILASKLVQGSVNPKGLQNYITFQFGLNQTTLFDKIQKLEPGYCLIANLEQDAIKIKLNQYWDLQYHSQELKEKHYYEQHLATLLENSVRQHLRSDVPIGAHLSGGLDSSTVVCLAAPMLEGITFKTFTGSFVEGLEFDETHYAKIVSEFSKTQYHETYIPSHEFTEILPQLIYYMDEPVAGPGLIPQYYVSKLASEHVKVVLGGQGGDELFVGYTRYLVAHLEKSLYQAIYQDTNSGGIKLESLIPNLPTLQSYKSMLSHFWQDGLFDNDDKRYFRLIDRSESSRHLFAPDVFTNDTSFVDFQAIFNRTSQNELIDKITYFDLKASLPALLQVEDRTSMAAAIESRVPLLDHRIVEYIANVPANIKFANGNTKHLFKETIKNIIPQQIFDRKDKMGFPVPINQWLQTTAKDFVADILFSDRAKQRGIYNIKQIENAYKNQRQFSRVFWGLLCLELWHRTYIDGDTLRLSS